MPDATPSDRHPMFRPLISGPNGVYARLLLMLALVGVLAFAGWSLWTTMLEKANVRDSQIRAVTNTGMLAVPRKGLADKFSDSQGQFLADPPTSPSDWLNPDTIVVAHIEGSDSADETPGSSWADWEKSLSAAIGKKVIDQTFTNASDQIAAAASGKVTLLALHAADTPFIVNNYGFHPVAVLGNAAGINGNHLDLIVPADSPINAPADIRGHKLVCTVPSSITGYRAAIAYLYQSAGLRPNVDYEIIWSLGQKKSITGLAAKKYDVAAISDDKLQSLIEKGTIDAKQIRTIYQSPVIPRTTIGYFYNLNPKLAEQLRSAILTQANAGSSASTAASTGMHFMPMTYKTDFEFVRAIDDQFDPRFDARAPAKGSE